MGEVQCWWCGKEFSAKRSTARCCSAKCKVYSNRRNLPFWRGEQLRGGVDGEYGQFYVNKFDVIVGWVWLKNGRVVKFTRG